MVFLLVRHELEEFYDKLISLTMLLVSRLYSYVLRHAGTFSMQWIVSKITHVVSVYLQRLRPIFE